MMTGISPFASGRHLKAARAAAGLSQAELAKLAALDRNSVKWWERKAAIKGGGYALEKMADVIEARGIQLEAHPPTIILAA